MGAFHDTDPKSVARKTRQVAQALAGWTDPDERTDKIEVALTEAQLEGVKTLTRAIAKLAPDLGAQIAERFGEAQKREVQALDEFLAFMRRQAAPITVDEDAPCCGNCGAIDDGHCLRCSGPTKHNSLWKPKTSPECEGQSNAD